MRSSEHAVDLGLFDFHALVGPERLLSADIRCATGIDAEFARHTVAADLPFRHVVANEALGVLQEHTGVACSDFEAAIFVVVNILRMRDNHEQRDGEQYHRLGKHLAVRFRVYESTGENVRHFIRVRPFCLPSSGTVQPLQPIYERRSEKRYDRAVFEQQPMNRCRMTNRFDRRV